MKKSINGMVFPIESKADSYKRNVRINQNLNEFYRTENVDYIGLSKMEKE